MSLQNTIIFPMHSPFIYEQLFYKDFVRRSIGQATKGRTVKYGNAMFSTPN